MIEAIPLNSECIVLIITKVEDPEELDTRFSKFAPSVHDETDKDFDSMIDDIAQSADDVLDLFKRIHEGKKAIPETDNTKDTAKEKASADQTDADVTRIFVFRSLNRLIGLTAILSECYHADNSLYKDETEGVYLLTVSKGDHTPEEFNRVCNVLSEYGAVKKAQAASRSYLEEHYAPLIAHHAIQSLAQMN